MEAQTFNRKKYQIIYCILLFFFASVSMVVMLSYASQKVIIVTAEESDNSIVDVTSEKTVYDRSFVLSYSSSSDDGWIHFTCPQTMVLSDISVLERPDMKRVTIEFKGDHSDFFFRNAPFGDFSKIESITENSYENVVRIVIFTKQVVYVESKMADHELLLKLAEFDDKKKVVVVVDPAFGGNRTGTCVGPLMEKDVNQAIANEIKRLAKSEDYRIVLTRNCDETLSIPERLDIIEAVKADYYLGIALSTDMDDQNYFGMKAVYNDDYYREGLENVDFADAILKKACESTLNKANSLEKAASDYVILKAMDIPATQLFAGTITNTEEAELLQSDVYIEKIAEGILSALDEVTGK